MIDQAAVAQLSKSFTGELITPEHPVYEQKRKIWNGSIDRRPSLIAACTELEDVRTAVRFGREHDLLVAVRAGGHSFPGLSVCDGGMVIDLRGLSGIRVDPEQKTVRAQAGVLLGELDRETQSLGLAIPSGIVTHTGLAGLTLGGGIGWIMRKYGLTIDQLVSVDLITAEGELVTADQDRNSELFWGVRGGGGNFGIVAEFKFRVHPLGPWVMGGPIFWAMQDAPQVLRFYRDWVAGCPDELMTIVMQRQGPDAPTTPPELIGKPLVGVASCYSGPIEEAERILMPLKKFGSPLIDLCRPRPYLEHQQMLDPSFQHGWWYYVRSCDIAELNDDVIDVVSDFGMRITSPISSIALWQMGGAVARVGENDTAFNGRNAGFTFNINGNSKTADGFEAQRQWARDYWSALAAHHTSVYVNFMMDEGEERIKQAYGPEKFGRLKALKRAYDPVNFFRLNQNIKPD